MKFSTVGQLTKIQDDAINALNDSKLDKSSVKNELGDSEELGNEPKRDNG